MDLRFVYAVTIIFVVRDVTTTDETEGVTSRSVGHCDPDECDAECRYKEEQHHGSCQQDPRFLASDLEACLCYEKEDSLEGWRTDISWCNRYSPDARCKPMLNRNAEHCNFDDCWTSCRSQHEGWSWREVRGFCGPQYCECFGKGNHWWWTDLEKRISMTDISHHSN